MVRHPSWHFHYRALSTILANATEFYLPLAFLCILPLYLIAQHAIATKGTSAASIKGRVVPLVASVSWCVFGVPHFVSQAEIRLIRKTKIIYGPMKEYANHVLFMPKTFQIWS